MRIPLEQQDHPDKLTESIKKYYTKYYKDDLGLKDWRQRVDARLNEEKNDRCRLDKLSGFLNINFNKLKVLIVGCGTGGMAVELQHSGAKAYGIDPSIEAIEITNLKATKNNYSKNFTQGIAENLPFKNESFDFIICFSVIEHVKSPEISIKEMIRVCKCPGYIYIATPDYRFPYEAHYKIFWIPILPKFLTILYLKLLGRPAKYFEHIQRVTAKKLDNILMHQNVSFFRILNPYPREWTEAQDLKHKLWYFISRKFRIS
jgi:2-polyprenyl-3-methyl-5-hydroxy-6-metoxy-1,4-benzoquinol methylase